jgi:predicted RecB family nuclease
MSSFQNNECLISPSETWNPKASNWRLAVDIFIRAHSLESCVHAIDRIQLKNGNKVNQFIPIHFLYTDKINQNNKLRIAYDTLILSEAFGTEISFGKIIHGDNHISTKINTAILRQTVANQIKNLVVLLSAHEPPDLVLKRYCVECEFQVKCRQMALEKDDLSLLASMTMNERDQYRSKGIFTVNQLSYTFRPRRKPKRTKKLTDKHYPALQALAIRENTIFINGSPDHPEAKTQVYLDIEGMPDNGSYYLIGALIVSDNYEKYHSFWANNLSEELIIFSEFIEIISRISDFTLFHYGNYEKLALTKLKLRLPDNLHQKIDNILNHSINVLSFVHFHFYFPCYSNSLKDIGKLLGYEWFKQATGLDTIIWRTCWNQNKHPELKANLIRYNEDDCRSLKLLCNYISRSKNIDNLIEDGLPKASLAQQMLKTKPHWQLFAPRTFVIEDFKHVNKCAYFDYQREKIFIRTEPHIKALKKKKQYHPYMKPSLPNKKVKIEVERCCFCQSRKIERQNEMRHDVIDLKFNTGGIKKCVTRFISYRYNCLKCNKVFNSEERSPNPLRYGHGLDSWCVYLNNACGVNFSRINKTLNDTFGLIIPDDTLYRSKRRIREFYEPLYAQILQAILTEPVIHVDETTVRLRGQIKGYVWVLTSMNKVYYFYHPNRETSTIKEMLSSFKGVLISDFYAGYDSIPCEQQKCLVHFIRDIDDDVLRNPFDNELKSIAQEFGAILRSIVTTIDKYGLRLRHLKKHNKSVSHFLSKLEKMDLSSEIASKYKKRFEKSEKKCSRFSIIMEFLGIIIMQNMPFIILQNIEVMQMGYFLRER